MSALGSSRTIGVLLSIALAAVLWLLNALSKSYDTGIPVNLTWTNSSKDNVVVNRLPERAVLQVQATGWKLLFESFQTRTLRLDLNTFGTRKLVLTQYYLPVFGAGLPRGLKLLSIQPDSILLETEPGAVKRVPLVLQAQLDFAPNCGPTEEAVLAPDSVWISGPASRVANMFFWPTEKIVQSMVKQTLMGQVRVQQSNRLNISVDPAAVAYKIPVDRFTEMSLTIPLTAVPESGISLIPNQVEVSFQVPMARYESIRKEDFRLDVDLTNQADSNGHLVDVRMVRHPEGLKQLHWHPRSVELIVRKHD
ncbi:MAG: hypothetical protein GC205_07860 [Bacteroidetes bacterium]|nr:hypothetical protein [Bacteroidota bacterium]